MDIFLYYMVKLLHTGPFYLILFYYINRIFLIHCSFVPCTSYFATYRHFMTRHKSKSEDHKMSQLGKFTSSYSKDIKNHLLWFYMVYIYVNYSFGNWSNKWEISSAQVIIIIYVLFVLIKMNLFFQFCFNICLITRLCCWFL